MIKPLTLMTCVAIGVSLLSFKTSGPLTVAEYAEACGLSEEEFVLFSSVVEAESDRSVPADGDQTTEGRIYIALTIWNRLNDSDRWHCETVTEVLTAPGQFSTVRRGSSVINRTEWSDRAVYEAWLWLNQENSDAPDVQFFRCGHYFSGVTPCCESGGNYFSYGY